MSRLLAQKVMHFQGHGSWVKFGQNISRRWVLTGVSTHSLNQVYTHTVFTLTNALGVY